MREVDLMKIESRAMRQKPLLAPALGQSPEATIRDAASGHRFNFVYFIEIRGHATEPAVQRSMSHLQVSSAKKKYPNMQLYWYFWRALSTCVSSVVGILAFLS